MLVGHGTRDELGTREFFQLGQLLADRCFPTPVESALLEFQEPTIAQAWQTLADQSCDHIHIAPLLLFSAGHAKSDIPEIVEKCSKDSPLITHDQCRPLSRHPAIIDLVVERLQETIHRSQVDPGTTAIVMVGRGSFDPCAQADMRVLSEMVQHRLNVAQMRTAFYAMAEPRLPEVLDQVARQCPVGGLENVIVHPHLLFHGRLFEAIARQTGEVAERFSNLRFLVSDYLGPDRRVADAIHFRVFHQGNHLGNGGRSPLEGLGKAQAAEDGKTVP